jgi:SAM-dependent methyltransferase
MSVLHKLLLSMTILIAGLVATPVECKAQTDDRPVMEDLQTFRQFRGWFFSESAFEEGERPREMLDGIETYHEHLLSEGSSEAEADAIIATLTRWSPEELEVAMWNIRLTSGRGFNTDPNKFLVRMLEGLEPGKALDVAMGQGRNTIYLAQKGWEVTGFDPADLAIESARQSAKSLGLEINTVVARNQDFQWGEDQWDLILLSYAGGRQYVEPITRSLRSGGVVILEAFHLDATKNSSIGRGVVFETNELLELFRNFRILHYEDVDAVADFGQQQTRVVRLMAQKL